MFIVHVVRQFHPGVGGLENVVYELASAQVSAGHRVRVVTLDRLFNAANRQRLPATETLDGIEIVRNSLFRLVSLSHCPLGAPAHQGRGSGSCPCDRFLLRLSRLDEADPWPHARGFDPWRLFSHRLRRQTEALLVCHGHAMVDEILRGRRRRKRVRLRTVQPGPRERDGLHRKWCKRCEVPRCVVRHVPEIDLVDRPLCQEQEDRPSDRFCAGVTAVRSRMEAHHRRQAGRLDGRGRKRAHRPRRPARCRQHHRFAHGCDGQSPHAKLLLPCQRVGL